MHARVRRRLARATVTICTVVMVLTGIALPAAAAPTDCGGAALSAAQARILTETNDARRSAGLAPLTRNLAMEAVATAWSQSQATRAAMSHNPSYSRQIPSGWSSAAENVAYGYAPSAVTSAWMASPGHRANILNSSLTHIGIGVACSSAGALYYTQNFGGYARPPSDFFDVSVAATFFPEISWLAERGVTTGWPDGTYRPYQPVMRDAMAAFIYRLAGSPPVALPATSPFVDVPPDHTFYPAIVWLYQAGISTGWQMESGREFRPWSAITRGEMAAFLYRYKGSPNLTSTTASPFLDVTADSPFAAEIRWLAAAGISTGWDAGQGCRTYRALDSVLRDVMAAFLYRSTVGGTTPPGTCARLAP